MSSLGIPSIEVDGTGLKVCIVAASWHDQIMEGLIDGALRGCQKANIFDAVLMRVPGTFELSVAAAKAVETFDVVVALGVVIRGGTPHFDYVCQSAVQGLTQVSVSSKKPVGFGVLTCDTLQQAIDRCGLPESHEDKGFDAALAAIQTAVVLRAL